MRRVLLLSLVLVALSSRVATGQETGAAGPGLPTFRAGVDLVTVNAVVRDQHGRVVTDLTRLDFVVLDSGVRRSIAQFRREEAPVSVALLIDASGSMQVAAKLEEARQVARQFLAYLQPWSDELAIYSFDTGLRQLQPFAPFKNDGALERSLGAIAPFGMTSLNDAIAGTARDVAERASGRDRADRRPGQQQPPHPG
jgi:VWFA-related protein